jgi:uncharacterized protein YjbI with pentapeptide repeats
VDAQFRRCKLIGVDWTQAGDEAVTRLPVTVSFDECVLDYGSFFGMSLHAAKLSGCSSREADFREADLTDADLSGSDFAESTFHHTNLSRADLRRARNYAIDPRANTVKKARFSLPEALTLLRGFEVEVE